MRRLVIALFLIGATCYGGSAMWLALLAGQEGGVVISDTVVFYKFTSDGSDSSGNGYDGTLEAGATADGVLHLNGTNAYVALGNVDALKLTNDFSISFWVNAGATQDNARASIYAITRESGSDYGVKIDLDLGNDSLRTYTYGPSIYSIFTTGDDIRGDGWNHIVFVYDIDTDVSYYRNGSFDSAHAGCPTPSYSTNLSFSIGAVISPTVATWVRGEFDNFRVISRQVTTSEITELYNEGHD